jgi:hypothetical protein
MFIKFEMFAHIEYRIVPILHERKFRESLLIQLASCEKIFQFQLLFSGCQKISTDNIFNPVSCLWFLLNQSTHMQYNKCYYKPHVFAFFLANN